MKKTSQDPFDTHAKAQSTASTGNTATPQLPHERDESAKETGTHEKPARTGASIEQAAHDAGKPDTDRRGTPNDVPPAQEP